MPTERTPLRQGENVPPYVFITNHNRSYKNKIRRFQCCICAGLLAIFITALVITVSYSVNHDDEDDNATITVSMATPVMTTPLPVSDPALTTLLSLSWPLQDKPYAKWDDPPNSTEIESAVAEGRKMLLMKEAFEEKVPTLQLSSPSYKHQMSTKTTPVARELSKTGFIMEGATKALMKKSSRNKPMGRGPTLHVEWLPKEVCSPAAANPCSSSPYRTADGSCNNLMHPRSWGVAMRPFRRVLPPQYADGISAPRKADDGTHLPSAREVSLIVHRPVYRDDPNFTVMLAVWGQFIDHDITATALSQGKGGSSISCCNGYFQSGIKVHPECYTVSLSSPDPYYDEYNVTCMEFVRSSPAPVCSFGPREQMNQATSFLDGSVVYGTSETIMNQLRTFQGGELKMLVAPDGQELLPVSTDSSDGCNQEEMLKQGRYCFLSGDPRSNENIHLTSMHLLLARQHNMIARKLATLNPDWDDEQLFQESRKIVAAQIQHITYNEFLPVVLGPHLMEKLKMTPRKAGYSETYDSTLDASIANSFAASAFRFGHTLLPGLVRMISGDNSSEEYVEMHKMLFNPFQLYDKGFLEKAVRGAMNTPVEKVDTYFNPEFTQHLFEETRKPSIGKKHKPMCGLDLVSLNVQRGRDHGLPGYPAFREHCGLQRPKSFADLEPHMDAGSLTRIKKMYKTVDDIDMYTGALSEFPVEGSLVGPTVTCLLTDQFLRVQRGDRYWYETQEKPQAFTPAQLKTIRETTLAKIICDTSGVDKAQPMVMRGKGVGNERGDCSSLPGLDLTAWQRSPSVPMNDAPGKIWLIKSTAPKAPTVVKLGGVVTTGSIVAEGTTVWSGALPIRIPTKPLDTIAQTTDSPSIPYPPVFGHGLLWSGSIMAAGGSARIDGKLSLPQYAHNPDGNVSVNWFNGDFSLQMDLAWNTSGNASFSMQGLYSSPLFYSADKSLSYLKNASVSDLTPVSSASTTPDQLVNENIAPFILVGTYSPDGTSFLWSGNVTMVIPLPKPEPAVNPSLVQMAYTPKSYVKRIQIGGKVTSGTISAQGYNIWSGGLPLAIPVDPFDTIAGVDESTPEGPIIYGNGINWKGSLLSSASKTATLSGSFSMPRFVHSDGITPFGIQWYNGDLSVDLDVSWWSSCDGVLSIDGTYTSPVYFGERKQYSYLKDTTPSNSLENLNIGFAGTPKQYEQGLKAPLVLLGTYSLDGKTFYWSGNFTLLLPQVVPLPPQTPLTTIMKDSTSTAKLRVPLRLVGGQVNVDGWNVWYNTLPLGIPTKPFDSVASVDDDTEPYDRPVVYGHGILWNGTVSTIDENFVKFQGTFSFPQFVHGSVTKNFSLTWLNGNFDLQLQSNKTLSMTGTFTTSVYFAERPTFETLRDISVNHVESIRGLGISGSDIPKVLFGDPEAYTGAPLILFGAYSVDKTEFLWSGDCILITPQTKAAPPTTNLLLKASAPVTATSYKLGGTVTKVNISVEGVNVTGAGKPPLSIPTALFDSVSTSYSAANTPPAFAQGVLWTGKLTNKPSSPKEVVLSGTFSLPTVENDTVSWYNGNFSLDIAVTWRNSNGTFADSFSSPLFFQKKKPTVVKPKLTMKTASFNSSTDPLVSPDVTASAPIILTGEFSPDNTTFLWTGEILMILPTTPKLLLAEPPTTAVTRLSVSAYANGGSITASGSTIWIGNRVPLGIPVQPFDSVVAPFDSTMNTPPTYGHGIPWKGYVTSDAPGTLKVWGAYSLPTYTHSNGTKDLKIDWYNGDFAFDLKLLFDTTTNLNLQGTYLSKIYFQERSTYAALTPEWSLSVNGVTPSTAPLTSPNETTSFIPVILLGSYTPDRMTFIWSGNVTFVVNNQTLPEINGGI